MTAADRTVAVPLRLLLAYQMALESLAPHNNDPIEPLYTGIRALIDDAGTWFDDVRRIIDEAEGE